MKGIFTLILSLSIALVMLFSRTVNASDYGCKVLLCLADPRGPTTESECEPPIEQLRQDLRDGKGFPTCEMAGGNGKGSFAKQGSGWYDDCPPGSKPLPQNKNAMVKGRNDPPVTGIGDGKMVGGYTPFKPIQNKVCVYGDPLETVIYGPWNDRKIVSVYTNMVLIPPAKTSNFIDVYVDGQVYRRVRW